METDELVDTLQQAGLSPYQATAYVTLLDLGTAAATDIADAGGVPAPRIYDVLRSLSDRGYVETYEQDTLRARAHSPTEVLEDLRERADRFEDAAAEVEGRWEQPELESNRASIVKRFQTVIDRARLFIEDATHQIYLSVTPEDFERLREPLAAAHDRGVVVDVSVQTDPGAEPPSPAAFEGVCREARHRDLPAPFVALVDRQKTCFAHHPDSFDQYGVLVNDQTHSFVFHWYFVSFLWEHCEVVHSERTPDPPIEYVDIRRLVRETHPVLEAGGRLTVRVEGHDLDTGEPREFVGTVEEERYASNRSRDADLGLAGRVTLLVDTGEERVSVGGWGAVIEEVEATRIVVEGVDHPDATVAVGG